MAESKVKQLPIDHSLPASDCVGQHLLADFQNVEHRLEDVAKIHGINFINDSKATNVNATWFALESMNKTLFGLLEE